MKNAVTIILSLFFALTLSAQSEDSSRFADLGLKLAEYYDAIKHESLSVQVAECDFLIETATDSSLRQYIAQNVYDHYFSSPIMGSENVAVHVFDKWFSDEKLAMSSPEVYADAKVYADFNRQSLIGCSAPALELERPDGKIENVQFEKYSVLFFYDTDCPKCRLQIRLLNVLFKAKNYPVDVYAVYVGDDRQKWTELFADEFTVHHFWDPTLASDFQRKYGVTQTPRMFLINPDGTIIGRGLDAVSLETMLDGLFAPKEMVYGGPESEELFDGIFAASGGKPQSGEVKGIADYIHDKTLSNGDTLMFKQLVGDYLYYLTTRQGEGYKEGLRYHIEKNVFSQDRVWTTHDDSLKVVGFAEMMSDLLSRALPGTRIPSIKVPGELYTTRRCTRSSRTEPVQRQVSEKLDKLKGSENIIIFYTEGCEICKAEKAAALSLLESGAGKTHDRSGASTGNSEGRKLRVFMVNMDDLMVSDPALASRLMDSFDLSSLPFIITTDRRGNILRRYLSLQ